MRYFFRNINKFKNLPIGTICEVTIYFGDGTYDYHQYNMEKIDNDKWQADGKDSNDYSQKHYKEVPIMSDADIIKNQHKFSCKNSFYMYIPNVEGKTMMYEILGDWDVRFDENIILEDWLEEHRNDGTMWNYKGCEEWIVNVKKQWNRDYIKYWCQISSAYKKKLEEKYGTLADTWHTCL